MKLSVAIAGEEALDSAFVVWRGFENSMKRAAEYGYDGVELALKNAAEIQPGWLKLLLEKYHLEVSCISTGQVFADTGLYFTDPDQERRKAVVKVFEELIYLAADFGGMINLGRVRGRIEPGETREQAGRRFYDTMEPVARIAERCGVTLVIEPVNRYEINFINSLDEGAKLLQGFSGRAAGLSLGLMPDVFHMNIEDDHIGSSLIRNREYIKYIHLADSNRLAPGWGHLDFQEIFDALHRISYNGWGAVEILPKPDPDSAAKQAAEFLRSYIHRGLQG